MKTIRSAIWALTVGVLAVALASGIFRLIGVLNNAVFTVLLIWSVGILGAVAALVVEISPPIGAAGGVLAGALVAAVFWIAVASAPLAPGATRPGLRDLFWTPLLALLAILALCALAGWHGVRAGLYLSRGRRGSGPSSRPTA